MAESLRSKPLSESSMHAAQRPPVLMVSPGLQGGKSKPQACMRGRLGEADVRPSVVGECPSVPRLAAHRLAGASAAGFGSPANAHTQGTLPQAVPAYTDHSGPSLGTLSKTRAGERTLLEATNPHMPR